MISSASEQPAPSLRAFLSFTSAAGGNLTWRIAIPVFVLISFFAVSRLFDPLGKHFRLVGILLAVLAITLAASRRALIFWRCAAGKVLPGLVAWILLAYFSAQHTESSFFYIENVLQGALLFAAAAGLFTTLFDFNKLFAVLAAAGLGACALSFLWSGFHNGRFALRDGPYADPNYYAMCLLGIAPIIFVSFAGKSLWIRISAVLATIIPLLVAVRTASRGGFVAMLAMTAVLFVLVSVRIRVLIASLSAVALVVMLAFLPTGLQSRLVSSLRIASPEVVQDPNSTTHTTEQYSAIARQTLLVTSIALTLNNPVFGVGPGNFGTTVAEIGRTEGFDWAPLNTHNSYTQISSETGIPGFILFVSFIVLSVKSIVVLLCQTSHRGANPDPKINFLASGLLVSLAATLTGMFFLSEGYNLMVFFWMGLACGLRLLVPEPSREEDEFVEMEKEQPAIEP